MKNLIQWKPFSELDDFFSDSLRPVFPALQADLAVDVYEENNTVIAKMSLPGVEESEIDIAIEDDVLHISGAREEEEEVDKKDYYSKEIRRGSFARTVRLPKAVEADKAEANYEDGVLQITMPIAPGAKNSAVKVPIKK